MAALESLCVAAGMQRRQCSPLAFRDASACSQERPAATGVDWEGSEGCIRRAEACTCLCDCCGSIATPGQARLRDLARSRGACVRRGATEDRVAGWRGASDCSVVERHSCLCYSTC